MSMASILRPTIIVSLMMCAQAIAIDYAPKAFMDQVEVSPAPSEDAYLIPTIEVLIPETFSPEDGALAKYWKADIVLVDPARNNRALGIVKFQSDRPRGPGRRQLMVRLSKELHPVAIARLHYRDPKTSRVWQYRFKLKRHIPKAKK